jgi:hypothetical protein
MPPAKYIYTAQEDSFQYDTHSNKYSYMTMKQGKKGNKDKSVYKVTTLALASLLY